MEKKHEIIFIYLVIKIPLQVKFYFMAFSLFVFILS